MVGYESLIKDHKLQICVGSVYAYSTPGWCPLATVRVFFTDI